MSGASGLLGRGLASMLRGEGHRVVALVRHAPSADEIPWDPATGQLDPAALSGFDAAVHLSGENISGRFTEAHKREVLESRTRSTRLLSESLARASIPPRALICASAIGYYGDRGDQPLDEDSPPGKGFLADVVKAWEASADPARAAGLRVCHLRVGVVLTREGGALRELLTPFRLGLGGRIGNGRQVWSWISHEDVVRAFRALVFDAGFAGAVNATAPNAATNKEFTRTLGKVLGRPTLLPLPAAVIKLVFGEMGETLLLEGARVLPRKLLARGFEFHQPDLEGALRHALNSGGDPPRA
jgi:uncharacterized protein (TIGR01777 family)